MAGNKVNGIAVASIGVGALFVYSGIKGWSILAAVGDIITGKTPADNTNQYRLAANASGTPGTTSSDIANDALRYQGHAYSYGGAPGVNGTNPWDCSSFVNWVVGHDLKMSIPGFSNGSYNGSSHGPPTGVWGVWSGLMHISASDVAAGDLIVWTGHMGIAISNTEMISALDKQQGTLITPIAGYGNGPLMCYGRFTVSPGSGQANPNAFGQSVING